MPNTAHLNPPFTRETAIEANRRSVAARRQAKADRERVNNPDYPRQRAAKQVNRILYWMETTGDREEYAKYVAMLDRLWDKAFPRQASVKPSRSRGSYGAMPAVVQVQEQPQTPQPVVSCGDQPASDRPQTPQV